MSAKSRKSLSSWLQCDKCQSILTQKGLSLHEKDCPPCMENKKREYSFILNGILYSTVELYQPQGMRSNLCNLCLHIILVSGIFHRITKSYF